MTNYQGSLNVSGLLRDSQGGTANFFGSLGVTLTATLNAEGSGFASQSVSGSVGYSYSDGAGHSGSGFVPINFTTPNFGISFGTFRYDDSPALDIPGAQFGVTLSGFVSADQSEISSSLSMRLSGTYDGVSVYGSISASGLLRATAPVLATISLGGGTISVAERAGSLTPVTVTATRTGNLTQPVAATWSVFSSGDWPVDGTDFSGPGGAQTGTVSFASGQSTQSIFIFLRDDDLMEHDEQFSVVLTAPASVARVIPTVTSVRILNDDIETRVIETNGAIRLTQVGWTYALRDGSGLGPTLRYNGAPAATGEGEFKSWRAIGAERFGGGYRVAWAGNFGSYIIWNVDSAGNYVGGASGLLTGGTVEFQRFETDFQQDLNQDGQVGVAVQTVESAGQTRLVREADTFYLRDGTGAGPLLTYQNQMVRDGAFGTWRTIGAERSGAGYLVAWRMWDRDAYVVWNTDANGNYLGGATGIVSGADPSLWAMETTFQQDLNQDGSTGVPIRLIESAGVTRLRQEGTDLFLRDGAGNGPQLRYRGAPVTVGVGDFTGFAPMGAERAGSGYVALWRHSETGTFYAWDVDTSGNYVRTTLSGARFNDPRLWPIEQALDQDVTGDSMIGPPVIPIEPWGDIQLTRVGLHYQLRDDTGDGPYVTYQGQRAEMGGFGAWMPIGAERAGTGYRVAWRAEGQDRYVVWNTDSAGAYVDGATGFVSGQDPALQLLEPGMLQDLNLDGRVGPLVSPVESWGGVRLGLVGDTYVVVNRLNQGAILSYQGQVAHPGAFGDWRPVGATVTPTGYRVAWHAPEANRFVVWNTDREGRYQSGATGIVGPSDPTLQQLETGFEQDLNLDGQIGAGDQVIEARGGTSLRRVGDSYVLGAGPGPTLQYQGVPVTPAGFGGWAPIGAEQTTDGYQVAWRATDRNLHVIWNTDTNGNYRDGATGFVAGNAAILQAAETRFDQDLNRDGLLGPGDRLIESSGTAVLRRSGNLYQLQATGGPAITLQYQGTPIEAGALGGWTPLAAEPYGGGYAVAWRMTGQNQYVVWQVDFQGKYVEGLIPVGTMNPFMPGLDFALEQWWEISFAMDLNGDGRTGSELIVADIGSERFDLTTVNLDAIIDPRISEATVTGGRGGLPLSFIGTPDIILLGAGREVVEYTVQAGSVVQVENFNTATDAINIDLLGTAPENLTVTASTVGGRAAMVLASLELPGTALVLMADTATSGLQAWLQANRQDVGGHVGFATPSGNGVSYGVFTFSMSPVFG